MRNAMLNSKHALCMYGCIAAAYIHTYIHTYAFSEVSCVLLPYKVAVLPSAK